MSWLAYLLVLLTVCAIWFAITRIWVASLDFIINLFKKGLGFNKKPDTKQWHSLEDIKNKPK